MEVYSAVPNEEWDFEPVQNEEIPGAGADEAMFVQSHSEQVYYHNWAGGICKLGGEASKEAEGNGKAPMGRDAEGVFGSGGSPIIEHEHREDNETDEGF